MFCRGYSPHGFFLGKAWVQDGARSIPGWEQILAMEHVPFLDGALIEHGHVFFP